MLQASSVITKNDPPSYYSWAKPRLTIDRVIRRLVRLSAVSWLALLIVVLVSTWRLVWSSVWSPNPIIRLLFVTVATVAAAAIVILVGKGGRTGGGSASIVTWRFAIVRVSPSPTISTQQQRETKPEPVKHKNKTRRKNDSGGRPDPSGSAANHRSDWRPSHRRSHHPYRQGGR